MLSAKDVSRYLLSLADADAGDLISHLKLQKLCYYSQGFHLALYDGTPLFSEEIEAWQHGPVVPALYHEYKQFEAAPIPVPVDIDFDLYSDEVKELLDEVYDVFGQFSAWKLRSMTHEEPPWKNTPEGGIINHKAMSDYFSTMISE